MRVYEYVWLPNLQNSAYIPLGRRFNRMETNEAECYAAINFLHNSHVYRDNRETQHAAKSKLLLNFIIITLWISIAFLSLRNFMERINFRIDDDINADRTLPSCSYFHFQNCHTCINIPRNI